MDYYILEKYINNTIELHIAMPKKGMAHWAFLLQESEIDTFKELGAEVIPREPQINHYQLSSIICHNTKTADAARELLDSLITAWTLGGDTRLE